MHAMSRLFSLTPPQEKLHATPKLVNIWWSYGQEYGVVFLTHTCTHARTHAHTHTHTFNGPFSGSTRVSRYQKGKTSLDFTEARDSEWRWHQLGHMQVCTLLQTDNHASTPPLSFFTSRMSFLSPNQQCQSIEGFFDSQCTIVIAYP